MSSAQHKLKHTNRKRLQSNTVRRHSENYNFVGNKLSGLTLRWGQTLQENPEVAPWPELADISISNRCSKGCDFCYKCSTADGDFLSLEQYSEVLKQLISPKWGPPFQIAIGGGEPTEHPELIEILKTTRKLGMIPNLTTNGENISATHMRAFRKFCGAVAISETSIDPDKIKPLLSQMRKAGVCTNLHFLLSRRSLQTAIGLLRGDYNQLLQGLNAIIFLTHKPMGRASPNDNLRFDEEMKFFLSLVDKPSSGIRFGFDACFVPLLLKHTGIDSRFVDSCECGFFSVYIDEKMNVKPCSFSTGSEFLFNLSDYSFNTIWQIRFEQYRKRMNQVCTNTCKVSNMCRGGCIFHESVNLCKHNN